MEVLGATAAALELLKTVSSLSYNYIKSVKNAGSDIKRFHSEVKELVGVFQAAQELLKEPRFQTSQELNDGFTRCFSKFSEIKRGLEKRQPSKGIRGKSKRWFRNAKWPLKRQSTEDAIRIAREFRGTLSTAITVDQAAMHVDCLKLLEDGHREKVLRWVSNLPYGMYHDTVHNARTAGTCEWLLRSEGFGKWEGADSSAILWLHGSPGAGKTFLTSKVIDHVQEPGSRSHERGVAYFYCNRNEEARRQPLTVFQSYVRQLSTTSKCPKSVHKELLNLYDEKSPKGSELGLEDCRRQILKALDLYQYTTLVLDALDECNRSSRGELLDALESLLQESKRPIKIFISSRPDRDIRKRFSNKLNIEIQAKDNEGDIRTFVHNSITKHENWAEMPEPLRNDIISVLHDRSQGMFQWAFLQIEQLLVLETEEAIRDRLGKLPIGLEATYDEICAEIGFRNPNDRDIAHRAILWVLRSRTSRSKELLAAIRINPKQRAFNLSSEITPSQLLHLCNNLLVFEPKRAVWRFSHLSVAEYFEKHDWVREAHSYIAGVSLKLLLETYKEPRNPERVDRIALLLNGDRLLDTYHYNDWLYHIHALECLGSTPNPTLANLLKEFLGSPKQSSPQYRAWFCRGRPYDAPCFDYDVSLSDGEKVFFSGISPQETPILAMCRFSLYTLLSDWWADDAEIPFWQTNWGGDDALALAAEAGCIPICARLIELGLDVNSHNGKPRSSLIPATRTNQAKTIDFLVDKGADVNMVVPWGVGTATALTVASHYGSAESAELLVKRGADVNHQAGMTACSSLACFARIGRIETLQCLVRAGAKVNLALESGYYGCALEAAASQREKESLIYLIEVRADVNFASLHGIYGTPLVAAAYGGNEECVLALIEAGAHVNPVLHCGEFGSPLAAAARKGSKECILALIKAGAHVNADLPYGEYGSPLAAAVHGGSKECISALIEAGAHANPVLPYGEYGSLLAAAAHGGFKRSIVAVIDLFKPDVNLILQYGKYGSALAAAAAAVSWNRVDCVKTLVEFGANVNLRLDVDGAPSRPWATALQAAQYVEPDQPQYMAQERMVVARILRDYGAKE